MSVLSQSLSNSTTQALEDIKVQIENKYDGLFTIETVFIDKLYGGISVTGSLYTVTGNIRHLRVPFDMEGNLND